jgi:anti-anti-sigma regulatory factor
MSISLNQSGESSLIHLEGTIDISSAAELKTALLDALKQSKSVLVALDEATDLDVTAVELLWAAGREAKVSGLDFKCTGLLQQPIRAALAEAGFEEFLVSL